jgi:hypothetical protein
MNIALLQGGIKLYKIMGHLRFLGGERGVKGEFHAIIIEKAVRK